MIKGVNVQSQSVWAAGCLSILSTEWKLTTVTDSLLCCSPVSAGTGQVGAACGVLS